MAPSTETKQQLQDEILRDQATRPGLRVVRSAQDLEDHGFLRVRRRPTEVRATVIKHPCLVYTQHGAVFGETGDWLVEGVEGEVYPVAHDVFKQTYDLAE